MQIVAPPTKHVHAGALGPQEGPAGGLGTDAQGSDLSDMEESDEEGEEQVQEEEEGEEQGEEEEEDDMGIVDDEFDQGVDQSVDQGVDQLEEKEEEEAQDEQDTTPHMGNGTQPTPTSSAPLVVMGLSKKDAKQRRVELLSLKAQELGSLGEALLAAACEEAAGWLCSGPGSSVVEALAVGGAQGVCGGVLGWVGGLLCVCV